MDFSIGTILLPTAAKLSTKDSVLFPQIFDCVLLRLIHPVGNREEQKVERIKFFRHRFGSLTPITRARVNSRHFAGASNQFQFLDITGLADPPAISRLIAFTLRSHG